MTTPIATAHIQIVPDFTGFAERVRVETAAALASLNAQTRVTTNAVRRQVGSIGGGGEVGKLGLDVGNLTSAFGGLPLPVAAAAGAVAAIGVTFGAVGTAATVFGAALAGIGVKASEDIGKVSLQVRSLGTDLTGISFKDLTSQIADLSASIGRPVQEVADLVQGLVAAGQTGPAAIRIVTGELGALRSAGRLSKDEVAGLGQAIQSLAAGKSTSLTSLTAVQAAAPFVSVNKVVKQLSANLSISEKQVRALLAAGRISTPAGLVAVEQVVQGVNKDGSAAADKVNSVTDSFDRLKEKVQKDLAPALDHLRTTISDTFTHFDTTGLTAAATKIGPVFEGVITKLAGALPGLITGLTDAFVKAGPVLIGFENVVLGIVGALESPAFGKFAVDIASITGNVGDALGTLTPIFKILGATFLEVTHRVALMLDIFSQLTPLISIFFRAFSVITFGPLLLSLKLVNAALEQLSPVFGLLGVAAQGTADAIDHAFTFLGTKVGQAVAYMLDALAKLFDGLGKLPDFLGGGKFDGIADSLRAAAQSTLAFSDASSQAARNAALLSNTARDTASGVAIFNSAAAGTSIALLDASVSAVTLQGAINALPDKKRIEVEVAIFTSIGQQNTDFLKSKGIAPTGLEDATGFSTAGIQAAAAANKKAADAAAKAAKDAAASVAASVGGAILPDQGAAKAAASKADALAKQRAAALKAAFIAVAKDAATIAKKTSTQSVNQLESEFAKLYEDLRAAGKASFIQGAKETEARLEQLARRRDTTIKQLQAATDKLNNLKQEALSFNTSIRDSIISLGNVSQPTKGIATTFLGIKNNLRGAIATATEFGNLISQLTTQGLNQTSLRQLVEAGPEAAIASARALAQSGKAGISEINGLQAQLSTQAVKVSDSITDTFYKAGISAAQGLVNGLKSQEAAIEAQMDRIGDKLVKQLQRALKIQSPSLVLANEVGKPAGQGIIKGLVASLDGVGSAGSRAVQSYATQVTFGPGSVVAHGATEASANRMGTGLGLGISDVIERQLAQARLGGVA